MEKKLTAMQELKKKLNRIILSNNHSVEFELALESVINDIDQNFIKLEREQIEEGYVHGYTDGLNTAKYDDYFDFTDGSDYFTQTYQQ